MVVGASVVGAAVVVGASVVGAAVVVGASVVGASVSGASVSGAAAEFCLTFLGEALYLSVWSRLFSSRTPSTQISFQAWATASG